MIFSQDEIAPNALNLFDALGISRNPTTVLNKNFLAQQNAHNKRSESFKDRLAAVVGEISALIETSDDVIKNANEAQIDEIIRSEFETLFVSLISQLQIMVGDILIKNPDQEGTWESKLKQQLFDKYQFSVNAQNYKNITDFYEAIYEAVFFSAYNKEMQKYGEQTLAENIEKVKVAADLQHCAGGAVAALKNISQAIQTADPTAQIIIEELAQKLTPYTYSGNQAHIKSVIEFILSGQKSPDELMIAAAQDIPMKDLEQLMHILTINSGDLIFKHFAKNIAEIVENSNRRFLEEIRRQRRAEDRDFIVMALVIYNSLTGKNANLQNLPADFEEFKDALTSGDEFMMQQMRFEKDFMAILEEELEKSPYLAIKEIGIEKMSKIANSQDKDQEISQVLQEKYCDQEKTKFLRHPKLLKHLETIIASNCYSIKNRTIPFWLQEKAANDFGIKQEGVKHSEEYQSQVTSKIFESCQNTSAEIKELLNINLNVLLNGYGTITFFQMAIDPRDGSMDLQRLIAAGGSLEDIKRSIQRTHGLAEISITGLVFHPEQQEIINFLETEFDKTKSHIPINYSGVIEEAIRSGDIKILTIFKDLTQILPGRWFPPNQAPRAPEHVILPHIDNIFQALHYIEEHQSEEEDNEQEQSPVALIILTRILENNYKTLLDAQNVEQNLNIFFYLIRAERQTNNIFKWLKEISKQNPEMLQLLTNILLEDSDKNMIATLLCYPENKQALQYFGEIFDQMEDENKQELERVIIKITKELNEQNRNLAQFTPFLIRQINLAEGQKKIRIISRLCEPINNATLQYFGKLYDEMTPKEKMKMKRTMVKITKELQKQNRRIEDRVSFLARYVELVDDVNFDQNNYEIIALSYHRGINNLEKDAQKAIKYYEKYLQHLEYHDALETINLIKKTIADICIEEQIEPEKAIQYLQEIIDEHEKVMQDLEDCDAEEIDEFRKKIAQLEKQLKQNQPMEIEEAAAHNKRKRTDDPDRSPESPSKRTRLNTHHDSQIKK